MADNKVGKENDKKMDSSRKASILIGIFFIVSTVSGILSVVILNPIMNSSDYLIEMSANENMVLIGEMLDLICAGAFVVVAVLMYPVLKKYSKNLALGYTVARVFEAIPFLIGGVSLLALLTLSQDFTQAGASDTSNFQIIGEVLQSFRHWTFLLGPVIFFSITALILNYTLFRSKLVPRWLSVWGFIGAVLMLVAGLLTVFGYDAVMYGTPVIAVNEMAFAVWIIIKGFKGTHA